MAITNRLVTGRFTVAVSDGSDGNQVFDNPYLSGVVVQFIPQPNFIVDSGVTTFLTTIEGVTDGTGHLKSSDGQVGVSVPVRDPAEGTTLYKVRVIPPDGSKLAPYEFWLTVAPGSTSLDISSTAGIFPGNPGLIELWVGETPPPNEAEGIWWIETTDPYRYKLWKWVP